MTQRDRTLVLLRHAKADKQADTDKHRALAAAGRRQAGDLGPLLREHLGAVDLALVSGAVRTHQTAELLAPGLDVARTEVTDELYEASVEDVLRLVRAVDPQVRTLLVVGHEPAVSQTSRLLHDEADDTLGLQVRLGVATATACVLDAPAWADVDRGTCHLRALLRPGK